MFGRVYHDTQFLYLNGYILSGIQSVGISSSFERQSVNILGFGNVSQPLSSIPIHEITVDRIIVGFDPVFDIARGTGLSTGAFVAGSGYIPFLDNAYINGYSLSCAVGDTVNSSFSIQYIGSLESGLYSGSIKNYIESTNIPLSTKIPTWASTKVTTQSYEQDRITSFNYEVEFVKEPIYAIGNRYPIEYFEKFPIRETLTLDIEIDKFKINEFKNKLCQNQGIESVLIQVESCQGSGLISIDFKSGRLYSQDYSAAIRENASIRLGFERFVNDLSLLSYSLTPSYLITGYVVNNPVFKTGISGLLGTYTISGYTGYNPSGLN